jgi:tetratricopeptide (TPR) repeat protein
MTNPVCPYCSSTDVAWKEKKRLWECNAGEEHFPGEETLSGESTDPLASREDPFLARAQILARHDLWDEGLITTAPGPIAHTYWLLRNLLEKGQVDASAMILKDFAELLARFSALVMARDVLEHGTPPLQETTRKTLFGPPLSMGAWIELANLLASAIRNAPTDYAVPQIANWWRCDGKGKRTATVLGALLADITHWRNETIGHGVRGDDLSTTMDSIERFLGTGPRSLHHCLDVVAKNPVVLTDAHGNLLQGANSVQPGHEISGHPDGDIEALWIRDSSGSNKSLSLAPYLTLRQCPICNTIETFHYNKTRKKQVPDFHVLNYERGHAFAISGIHGADFIGELNCCDTPQDMSNEASFDAESLPAEVVELLESQSVEKKYLSPAYLRDSMRDFIESRREEERGGVYWLQAPAHVGKSTFVRGLDTHYAVLWKESDLIPSLAVAVFYIRREYQFHCAQFADQLRDLLREALGLRSQTRKLPDLDIYAPNPRAAFAEFLKHYQVLSGKPLLIVIDGLDELGEEHPGIADFLPITDDLPRNIFVLMTSRPILECPRHIQNSLEGSHQNMRRIDLEDSGYRDLMREYVRKRLVETSKIKASDMDALLPLLYDKSDGRFLHFAFLVDRLADGDIRKDDLQHLTVEPERLVPDYLRALLQRYENTPMKDLLQRMLCNLAAAEEAALAHEQFLPLLGRETWTGLPMEVLCLRLEGQDQITPRMAYALYLLKPVLGTWRAEGNSPRYRLGIKGMCAIVRQIFPEDVARTHDQIVQHLLKQPDLEAPDAKWAAFCLDGHGVYLSALVKEAIQGPYRKAIESIRTQLNQHASKAYDAVHYPQAASLFSITLWILKILWSQGIDGLLEEPLLSVEKVAVLDLWAGTLYSYALPLAEMGNTQGAVESTQKAIAILESMREHLGDQFSLSMADTLAIACMNLGNYLAWMGNTKGAVESTQKAITLLESLREPLGDQYPLSRMDTLACACMNLGNHLAVMGNTQGAVENTQKAITLLESLREPLGDQYPLSMMVTLASAHINLGNREGEMGNISGAMENTQAAITLWEFLSEHLGDQFSLSMANSLASAYGNLGTWSSGLGGKGAVESTQKAIAMLESLREHPGNEFLPGMANSLANAYGTRGSQLSKQGNTQEAVESTRKAITLWESLREHLGDQFQPNMAGSLAIACMDLGNHLAGMGNTQGAVENTQKAITLWETLREHLGDQFPLNMADRLAGAYLKLSNNSADLNDTEAAMMVIQKAIALWESLRDHHGNQFSPSMADSLACAYMNLGIQLFNLGGIQWAVESTQKAIATLESLREHLGDQFPSTMAANLAGAYRNLGSFLSALRDEQGAKASADKAANIYAELGAHFYAQGEMQQAIGKTQEATTIWEELLRNLNVGDQFSLSIIDSLALAYVDLGNEFYDIEHFQAALENFDRSLSLLRSIKTTMGDGFPEERANLLKQLENAVLDLKMPQA